MTPPDAAQPAPSLFRLGLENLLTAHADWLTDRRVGLVSHLAAVDASGLTSAERLWHDPRVHLTALFGPEHGFAGQAGAGELTRDAVHPEWSIPIFSLYGEDRKPSAAMLDRVDVLIVELQDLGARPYTYVSTLRLVLEAASEAGKTVIVADRPVPLPNTVDGPMLNTAFESFVGLVPAPMQYGMTPAETASWLKTRLGLPLDLRLAPMRHYFRESIPPSTWPAWVPPSPRIRSWETGCLFTATVCGEALTALDYGSGSDLSFQVMGAPWLDARRLIAHLNSEGLPGVTFEPIHYQSCRGLYAGTDLEGIKIVVSDYASFHPVTTCILILDGIQRLYGTERLWSAPGTRPEWFDKLFGTDQVRLALLEGRDWRSISRPWVTENAAFHRAREACLLYGKGGAP
jgi:uncharacterized protein YbbC (DUF1343 family)